MTYLKLSIVIPIYNVQDYLSSCIDSVLIPDCNDYEIILVNDGSTDDSGQIAADYALRFPALIRLISTKNGGLGAARNVGLEASVGDFVFFLDSDDRLAEGALSEILSELTPDCDILIFDFLSVTPGGTVIERLPGCGKTGALSLSEYPELLLAYPSGCNKICRRSLFLDNNIRFPGRVWYEDLRTMPKLYPLTARIRSSGKAWYFYTMRPGSITNSAQIERNLEIIDAVDDLLGFYREHDLYERFKLQLDYVAFYNMFLTASVRICMANPASPVLPQLKKSFLRRFPDYKQNGYVRSQSSKHRLLTKLLVTERYRAVAVLMRLNDSVRKKSAERKDQC